MSGTLLARGAFLAAVLRVLPGLAVVAARDAVDTAVDCRVWDRLVAADFADLALTRTRVLTGRTASVVDAHRRAATGSTGVCGRDLADGADLAGDGRVGSVVVLARFVAGGAAGVRDGVVVGHVVREYVCPDCAALAADLGDGPKPGVDGYVGRRVLLESVGAEEQQLAALDLDVIATTTHRRVFEE
jgi:hypothetical protein